MSLTRRELLARLSALGAVVALPPTVACDGGAADDDLPDDGFPVYSYTGTPGPEDTFAHGVASGDPLADAVLVWTRVGPAAAASEPTEVFVEVAEDEAFTRRLAASWHEVAPGRDGCLTLDLTDLPAGTTLYFRFSALGRVSPVGRTRTLPTGSVERVTIAACSCSNYAYGYFHAYRHLSRRDEVDVVLHLGDYIYEYANPGFGETYGVFRKLAPDEEMVSLDQYRTRYAHYRLDPDLAEVHRKHPFIHVWDDHEFTCDPFVGGAVNHQPETEGSWEARIAVALQAYQEWMPTRLGPEGRIYRAFAFGDLATLVMLDRQRRFLWPDDGPPHYLGQDQRQFFLDTVAGVTQPWLVVGQGTTFAPRTESGSASWDADSRREALDAVAAAGIENLVVLTGDIHKFDALDIYDVTAEDAPAYDPDTGAGSEGFEIATGAITSPGGPSSVAFPPFLWSSAEGRGYVVLTLTPAEAVVEAWAVPVLSILVPELPEESLIACFRSAAGSRHLVREALA